MQAILECKQCGGQLNPDEGQKITYCKFCGSANAISVADRFGLYNRANYLRRQNEFDRAIGIYEDIIKEDSTDAEGYFGLALCKYGIEYVDDPDTGKKMPTCHRTRFTLMSQDEDFKKAIEYADSDTLAVYMDEATKIDTILKKIQQLSSKQEKYDVFICYKESDENGERTQTSVLAQDIYERLTNKGYKTFFARKTLESKLGSDYEPIIFSALYSAKVMLVIGNKPEEFQAVWVRNEWVRFMERISKGEECTLIPLYKDMSPYELPNELANIQALDMGKIGYVQDLFDGIGKLLKVKSPETVSMAGSAGAVTDASNVSGIKKRAYLFLEQGDFTAANQYFERVLDHNPEDSESYWGKLLAKFECCKEEDLESLTVPISEMKSFQMAMRFGTDEQREKYQRYSDIIDTKLHEEMKRREEEAKQRAEQERIEAEERERDKQIRVAKKNKAIALTLTIIALTIIAIMIGKFLYSGYTHSKEKQKREVEQHNREELQRSGTEMINDMYNDPYIFENGQDKWLLFHDKMIMYPDGSIVFILSKDGEIGVNNENGTWAQGYMARYTAGEIIFDENGYPSEIERDSIIPYEDRKEYIVISGGDELCIRWGADGEKIRLRRFTEEDILE